MSRSRTHIPSMVAAVLLLAACSSPRKVSERACNKAEKYIAKAVWLCPDVLSRDSASVTIRIPGDSMAVKLHYPDPIVDSLLKACADFAAAVSFENERLKDSLAEATIAAVPPEIPAFAGMTPRHGAGVPAAIEKIREEVCAFEPFEQRHGLIIVKVSPGPDGVPVISVRTKEETITQKAPCPPLVTPPPPKPWWMHVLDTIETSSLRILAIVALIAILLVLWRSKGIGELWNRQDKS
ncbi:MAG TPA: hypothetical protein PLB89_04680 [Flavobacteriales bacterium]|nr:hypothetical protein [Flavobacteriales bacterium]